MEIADSLNSTAKKRASPQKKLSHSQIKGKAKVAEVLTKIEIEPPMETMVKDYEVQ